MRDLIRVMRNSEKIKDVAKVLTGTRLCKAPSGALGPRTQEKWPGNFHEFKLHIEIIDVMSQQLY